MVSLKTTKQFGSWLRKSLTAKSMLSSIAKYLNSYSLDRVVAGQADINCSLGDFLTFLFKFGLD